jgi:hypothetical protein
MYVKTSSTTFVYGRFVWPKPKERTRYQPAPAPLPVGYEDIAIEVLREYSSAEFLGKLYARGEFFGSPAVADWSPIAPAKVSSYDWYKWFSSKQQHLYFAMEGSGYWEVINFRNESDENGPYVAVGLKYRPQSSLPKWVVSNPV